MRLGRFILVAVLAGGCEWVSLREDLTYQCASNSDCAGGACVNGTCTAADAGSGADGGTDAGVDAGTGDAGTDGGDDAGFDAGPSFDAGPHVEKFGQPGDVPIVADFLRQGRTDLAFFRPGTGVWFIKPAGAPASALRTASWGLPGDQPFTGDFMDLQTTQLAQYRSTDGTWYIVDWFSSGSIINRVFGSATEVPLVGNFVGNAATDFALYEVDSGVVRVMDSQNTAAVSVFDTGVTNAQLVGGPFLGNGRDQLGLFKPKGNSFTVLDPLDGGMGAYEFGATRDDAYAFNYFQPDRADMVVFRPTEGNLYVGSTNLDASTVIPFGQMGDIFFHADFFDAGYRQLALWRPDAGEWWIRRYDKTP